LSDRKENGTANHAEHAKGGGALQTQNDAFDLKARLAGVEQQAEMQAPRHLQFNRDDVFDE